MTAGNNQYNILHFSDLHIDYNYKEGRSSDCKDLVCCQDKHGSSGYALSKKYGNAQCDTPEVTLNDIIDDVKDKVATPEIILVTGGLVTRDANLTQAQRVASFGKTIAKFKTAFPTSRIFVALGNTDITATNQESFAAA